MAKNDLQELFEEIAHELKNPVNKHALRPYKNDFDYEKFQKTIDNYIGQITLLDQTDEALFTKLIDYSAELRDILLKNETPHKVKNFLSAAIFLMDHAPEFFPEYYIGKPEIEVSITREEFSERYDRLIKQLNPLEVKSNLTITTKAEKAPFELYRNSNNSIAVKSGQERTPLSFTKNRLLAIVYDGFEATHHTSYSDVIIEKILDNTIFDFIGSNPYGFDFNSSDPKFKKIEEDRLQTVGKIKELEDKLNEQLENSEMLNNLLEQSKAAEESFLNAKKSVLKDIELQKSYKFWEFKQKRYFVQYILYLVLAISLSLILLFNVSSFLEKNPLIIDIKNTQQEVSVTLSDNNVADKTLTGEIKRVQLWEYGFLIFATTLAIWLIKIFVKITLSNYHLSIDSGERVIMIRTYLALLKEGHGFEEKDKKVMLDNIFRPTTFGIIQDETSVTIADIVSSFKK